MKYFVETILGITCTLVHYDVGGKNDILLLIPAQNLEVYLANNRWIEDTSPA